MSKLTRESIYEHTKSCSYTCKTTTTKTLNKTYMYVKTKTVLNCNHHAPIEWYQTSCTHPKIILLIWFLSNTDHKTLSNMICKYELVTVVA